MVVSEVPPSDTSAGHSGGGPSAAETAAIDDVRDARILARIDRRLDAVSDYLINTHIDALMAARIADGANVLLRKRRIDLSDERIDALIDERIGDRLDFRIDWRVDARLVTLDQSMQSGATDALIDARIDARVARWFEARLEAIVEARIAARLRRP